MPVTTPGSAAPGSASAPEPGGGSGKHHEDRHDKPVAATNYDLEVVVDGTSKHWGADEFGRVDKLVGKNNDGDARDVWSLRDLAHALVGPTARVTKVGGESDQPISADAWADASRTPILHNTRKGKLKFRWADKDGKWLEDGVVKDVGKLEIASK